MQNAMMERDNVDEGALYGFQISSSSVAASLVGLLKIPHEASFQARRQGPIDALLFIALV